MSARVEVTLWLTEEQVKELRMRSWASNLLTDIADQVRAQTKPPKPAEPTGLGAVVEDADGRRWTRTRSHDHGLNWREEWGGRWTTFAELDAVRVLSEGVSA